MRNTTKTSEKNKKSALLEQKVAQAIEAWPAVKGVLFVPRNEKEYDQAVKSLNILLDAGGADEKHPLATLVTVLGSLMETYEIEHHSIPTATGVECLKELMEAHGLKQSDLPELGNQSTVSQILNGKRKLNLRQVKALSERFKVSPAVFVD